MAGRRHEIVHFVNTVNSLTELVIPLRDLVRLTADDQAVISWFTNIWPHS